MQVYVWVHKRGKKGHKGYAKKGYEKYIIWVPEIIINGPSTGINVMTHIGIYVYQITEETSLNPFD